MTAKTELIIRLAHEHGLITNKRDREIVYKRYYLYSELRPYCSLQFIADIFQKDHASVHHGIKCHNTWMSNRDYLYLETIQDLYNVLNEFDLQLDTTFDKDQIMVQTTKIVQFGSRPTHMIHMWLQFKSDDLERFEGLNQMMSVDEFKQML